MEKAEIKNNMLIADLSHNCAPETVCITFQYRYALPERYIKGSRKKMV